MLVATRIDGARVYWKKSHDMGRAGSFWTGTQAWRRLPLVTE